MIEALKKLLAHPDIDGLSIDDPRTTERRRGIIQGNQSSKTASLWRECARTASENLNSATELGGPAYLRRHATFPLPPHYEMEQRIYATPPDIGVHR